MSNIQKKDGDSEGDSGFVTPDSTTREKVARFSEGEDVLSHGKDGIYYLGAIVLVDTENDRCLIQFEDRTAHWSLFKDITKLRIPESDELCVVCKSSKSSNSNEIVLCHICDQGYHQKCLQPKISDDYCENESQWECPQCICKTSFQKEDRKKSKENSPRKPKLRQIQPEEDYKVSLPYDLKCLTWDPGHKSNKEETYCYCGGPGEWYNQMLQCRRCKQWFHEACVDCLHVSLLYGDRFYVFVCSLCNEGSEFVHRLSLSWVDVIHLATFNLTLQESKTYFDYDTGITQWINRNWESLQCPLNLQKMRVNERKDEVLRLLEMHRSRFKCGLECRKKSSLWSLRARVPPPVPYITLPSKEIITEQSINKFIFKQRKGSSPPIPRNHKIREEKVTEAEELLNRFSPAKKRAISPPGHHQSPPGHNSSPPGHNSSPPGHHPMSADEYDEDEEEIPLNLDDEDKARPPCRKKRKREVDILMDDKKVKKMIEDICYNGVTQSSRLCTQSIVSVPPPAVVESSEEHVKRKRGRPPKNPPHLKRSRSGKLIRELHHRRSHNLARDAYKEIKEDEQKESLGHGGDTSGDDTSSHGTLESFIPPPSNFEGSNHPFLNLDASCYAMPVARPLKRQLSESDIKIGKNGEIKRRRFRRKLDKAKYIYVSNGNNLGLNGSNLGINGSNIGLNGSNIGLNGSNIGLNGSNLGLNGSNGLRHTQTMGANIRNCVDYALNGRLQQTKAENGTAEDSPQYSLSDLKSSVNSYFGAVNRIANGEKFHILAKRTYENRIQYLIEWDTTANT